MFVALQPLEQTLYLRYGLIAPTTVGNARKHNPKSLTSTPVTSTAVPHDEKTRHRLARFSPKARLDLTFVGVRGPHAATVLIGRSHPPSVPRPPRVIDDTCYRGRIYDVPVRTNFSSKNQPFIYFFSRAERTAECKGEGAAAEISPVGIELDRRVESANGVIRCTFLGRSSNLLQLHSFFGYTLLEISVIYFL